MPEGGAEGVIIAQGGEFGGWSLYLNDGKPTYCYNLFGLQRFNVEGDSRGSGGHAPGADGVRLRRRRARARAATSRSTSTASSCGEGRVEGTVPMIFSGDETCDVGSDTGSPVSDDYTSEGSRFTGTVKWVQLDIARPPRTSTT